MKSNLFSRIFLFYFLLIINNIILVVIYHFSHKHCTPFYVSLLYFRLGN
uniref:Uncharacterized protein n=1 Tax=Anguilla anguilla TaxID=7936 RepID=A0A0E9XIM9_ANGAN